MKRIMAILLVLSCVFSMVACAGEQPGTTTGGYAASTSNADVWCAMASAQILVSEKKENYSSVRQDKIYVDAAKNDYESAQIIVSAKEDLNFTVSVSDLQHTEDANAKISANNCSVYTQMYIAITKNLHGNGAPTGKYPDALLPQENAVEYGKNIVRAGQNGGAWLKFYIPSDAKAGNYTGKATVDLGNEQVTLDISLKVYDVMIPEETTSKSICTLRSNMMMAYELDSTSATHDKYMEFFIEHRLATQIWAKPELGDEGDSDAMIYAKTAYYWYEKGLRTIILEEYGKTYDGHACVDFDAYQEKILALAEVSLEKNVDLCRLTTVYDYAIDEPFYATYSAETVKKNIDVFNQKINQAVQILSEKPEFNTELGKKIIESVKNTPLIVTDYYDTEFYYHEPMKYADGTLFSYEGLNVSLCPKVDGYNTAEQRAQYDKLASKEKWWYNCNTPSYPYPSWHTDDTPVSAMMFGWMMADYGITGNLWWCVNTSFSNGEPVEDPYAYNNTDTGANGEGTIIYPGKMYGVEGPVGTLRTEASLDGLEDYELIKWMKNRYAEKGADVQNVLDWITASLYEGSKVHGSSADYEEARKLLLAFAEACNSDAEITIASIKVDTDASGLETYIFEIKTAEGVELYDNGQKLTAENGVYRVVRNRDNEANYLALKGVINGKEVGFSLYFGGAQKIYLANSFTDKDFTGTFASATLVDGVYKFTFEGNQANKITIQHDLIKSINKNTEFVVFRMANDSQCQFKVFATFADFGRVEFQRGTLEVNGEITLSNFSSINWERNGELIGLEIQIVDSNEIGIAQIAISAQ